MPKANRVQRISKGGDTAPIRFHQIVPVDGVNEILLIRKNSSRDSFRRLGGFFFFTNGDSAICTFLKDNWSEIDSRSGKICDIYMLRQSQQGNATLCEIDALPRPFPSKDCLRLQTEVIGEDHETIWPCFVLFDTSQTSSSSRWVIQPFSGMSEDQILAEFRGLLETLRVHCAKPKHYFAETDKSFDSFRKKLVAKKIGQKIYVIVSELAIKIAVATLDK